MSLLAQPEIDQRLAALACGWTREADTIQKNFERSSFLAAVALIDAIAELAERANHHPDLLLHAYRHVRVTLTTHSAGGLTARDFELASKIDAIS